MVMIQFDQPSYMCQVAISLHSVCDTDLSYIKKIDQDVLIRD